ncbi:cobalamin biosynthesis protein CobG [Nostocoides sp. HKS02]|uniref:cobalamin biosynthesis protein CobG n=1 Tax=Nostocoides sp. HKS02 TaxID=1813880 RepID=UPI001E611FAD|nr:cobalamin biosynthesis protein CobG [Tetrasphaera sp. HKS02]
MSAQPHLDRCPGLLRPHRAEDGALVRLRLPGGRIAVSALREVLEAAAADGAGRLQLTSRGNLQVRALPDPLPDRFVERIEATGLLPSTSHERVRNIVASPLAPDLAPLVAALDAGLVADPVLAALSGRFLFALADASGSVLTEPYDVAWQSTGGGDGMLLAAGRGVAVPRERAVPALLGLARDFLVCRGSASVWNVRDLPADAPLGAGMAAYAPRVAPPIVPGPVGDDLVAGVPLGVLTSAHVEAMAALADTVVVTPWRSVVVPGAAAAADDLAAAGLVTHRDSPWSQLSACIGAPACAHGRCSTTSIAADVAGTGRHLPRDLRIHLVGCERQCGARPDDVVVVAPADADEVLATVAELSR